MSKHKDWNKDVEQAIQQLKEGKGLSGEDGAFKGLLKKVIEASLDEEMEHHLQDEKSSGNRRNGKARKRLKTEYGQIDIEPSRDRNGTYEPQLIGKKQSTLGQGVDNKIINLFALGMSHRDIQQHLSELYGLEASSGLITSITDKILPEIEQWQLRPLESVYACMYLDGFYYKSRDEDGRIVKKVAYSVLGVDMKGQKEILGIYMVEGHESAKMWMQVLTDLKERGVEDILIVCVDDLSGFTEAIHSIYEDTRIQKCVIHQVRNSLKYVSSKEIKEVSKELRKVYQAPNKNAAANALDRFEEQWGKRYPVIVKSWRENWEELTTYFEYPQEIRKLIYTTNIVEGYHRNVRKRIKTKGAFSSDKTLLKLLYLIQTEMGNKWGTIRGWPRILQQLKITFKERLDKSTQG